jgi:hypothetical protein
MATRSSSAWVALNSMRFIFFPGANLGQGPSAGRSRRRPCGRFEASGRRARARGATQAAWAALLRGVGCGNRASSGRLRHCSFGWALEDRLSRERGWCSSRYRSNGLVAESPLRRITPEACSQVQNSSRFKLRCAARHAASSCHWPVRRPRSSINIVTFPARRVRTVNRFNLAATACPVAGAGKRLQTSI